LALEPCPDPPRSSECFTGPLAGFKGATLWQKGEGGKETASGGGRRRKGEMEKEEGELAPSLVGDRRLCCDLSFFSVENDCLLMFTI